MSSWRPTAPTAPIRLGYKQLSPEGRFQQKPTQPTVVSSYYPMKSKHSLESYRNWIRQFLEILDCPLVFFTEEGTTEFILSCRQKFLDKTKIVAYPREQWTANIKFPHGFWDAQWALDPEKNIHSPELYKIWYEKKEFVKRAIELNPFESNDFVWCDAGILRHTGMIPLIKQFPVGERIPTDRFLMANTWPFTRNDEVAVTINGETFVGGASGKPRIGGNILAADAKVWDTFSAAYDKMVEKFLGAKLFIGKDQTILTTLLLEHRSMFSLVDSKQFFFDPWVFILVWLGAPPRLFEFLKKEPWYGRKRSLEDLARMI